MSTAALNVINEWIIKLSNPAGRMILGIYFLLPGIMKFTQFQGHTEYMAAQGMVLIPFFLILSGIMQIGGALALFAGFQVRLTAFLLAGLTLIISLVMQDFCTRAEVLQRADETQNFFKNMGIMAGLLVLTNAGAGIWSMDNRLLKSRD